ncbi:hypothetical protein HOLleu_20871 [Holothuria leucospilota]|uniref:Uncharacterized protein n=1 Tax=Holothuria leucospilota TaxID=206669 RepID=A0A9Q1BWH1_HOLLE|nr:hypothetical protein HOLleu_20871 [Holothuria leucospilota]
MDDFRYNDSLWGAAISGNIDRVREILSDPTGKAQINQTNRYGYTPLQKPQCRNIPSTSQA